MELRLLTGAHRTGLEHLRVQLEHNADVLAKNDVLLPSREVASQALAVALKTIRKGNADDRTGPAFLKNLTGGQEVGKVLLIDPDISGSMLRPTKKGIFYPRGNATTFQLIKTLEGWGVRLYFGTRNPASFLPSCYSASLRHQPKAAFEDFIKASDPMDLRWSEYLHRIQGKDAEIPVTVWSFEDYPFIWREVAQALGGLENKELLVETDGPIVPEMSVRGAVLMHQFLQQHPAANVEEFDRIEARFIEKFPARDPDHMEDVWPADLVSDLTDAYDDDNYYIDRMDNLTIIRREHYA